MSYNKHTWATGNVVGAVDLNRMEQGIEEAGGSGGGIFICTASSDENEEIILNKTFGEIKEAFLNGLTIWIHEVEENVYVLPAIFFLGDRVIQCLGPMSIVFYASSDNDYPSTATPDSPVSPD